MDVLHPLNPEAAMATADDLMELSAEARTPMGDDIDIDFGDGDQINVVEEDQDMVEDEDEADVLLDDEMEDEDALPPPQLDTDVDFEEPHDEMLASAEEANMLSHDTTDIASPMAQGTTPAPDLSFAPMPEAGEPQEAETSAVEVKAFENAEAQVQPIPTVAVEDGGVAARDFATEEVAAPEIPQIVEHPPSAGLPPEKADHPETAEEQYHQEEAGPQLSNNLQDHNGAQNSEGALAAEAVPSADGDDTHQESHDAEEDFAEAAEDEKPTDVARSEADSFDDQAPIHAIVVDYQGSKMSLFPPSTDHEGSESFLLEDEALCHEPISSLLADCRRVLKGDVLDSEEVILHVPCLDISIAEDAAGPMSATMSDLIELFLSLSYNDGIEIPGAMAISLEVKPRMHTRLDLIRSLIAEGKGLSHIYKDAEAATETQEPDEAARFVDSSRDEPADAAGLTNDNYDDADDQASEPQFEEQFEVRTPGQEGSLQVIEEEDYLDFASPYKTTKDVQPDEHAELGDTFGEVKVAFGHQLGPDEDSFASGDFVNDPGQEFDEVNLQGHTDAGLDLDEELDDGSYQAGGSGDGAPEPDTNQSSTAPLDASPAHDAAADAEHDSEPAAATAADTLDRVDDDDDGAPADAASPGSVGAAALDTPANDDESHTEVGDDPAKGPASPSSLKRRRSYEDAADLLDDALTPSPQAKRTRPS